MNYFLSGIEPFFRSIRFQIALAFSFFSLMTVVSLLFLIFEYTNTQLMHQQETAIHEQILSYRNTAISQLERFDYIGISELTHVISQAPNIVGVQIKNEFDQEVARFPDALTTQYANTLNIPLLSSQNKALKLGTLNIWWTSPNTFLIIQDHIKDLMLASLALLITLSLAIYHFLDRAIAAPLKSLQARINGEIQVLPNTSSIVPYEIESLQQHYQKMERHVSEQMQALTALAQKHQRIYEVSPALLLIIDYQGHVLQASAHLLHFLQAERDELIGLPFVQYVNHDFHTAWDNVLEYFATDQDVQETLLELRTHQQETRRVLFSSVAEGNSNLFIAFLDDITEEHRVQTHLERLATTDTLTSLRNRHAIEKLIANQIGASRLHRTPFAVMFLDLDHFKKINDVYGHAAGDQVLQHAAQLILSSLPEGSALGRFGGDEFVILVKRAHEAQLIINTLYKKMQAPLQLDQRKLYIGASIGVAMWPQDGGDMAILLRNADMALYQAKRKGRNQACLFSPALEIEANRWLVAGDALRQALHQHSFNYLWQPIYDRQLKVRWSELLLRMNSPTDLKTLLTPSDFLSTAEESGLMGNIATFTLDFTLQMLKTQQHPHGLALNLSRSQLLLPNLIESLEPLLPWKSQLIIEVTEEAFLGGVETKVVLGKIFEMGFIIALDDFGSGYSSLSILRNLPFHLVKLDKEFQRNIQSSPNAPAMIHSITHMLHMLGKQVIAEGIETREQYQVAVNAGCDYFQGYYFSRPVSVLIQPTQSQMEVLVPC